MERKNKKESLFTLSIGVVGWAMLIALVFCPSFREMHPNFDTAFLFTKHSAEAVVLTLGIWFKVCEWAVEYAGWRDGLLLSALMTICFVLCPTQTILFLAVPLACLLVFVGYHLMMAVYQALGIRFSVVLLMTSGGICTLLGLSWQSEICFMVFLFWLATSFLKNPDLPEDADKPETILRPVTQAVGG